MISKQTSRMAHFFASVTEEASKPGLDLTTIRADAFERIERGELKRCIINLPPRHTKSKFTSVLFPAWYLGGHPTEKILECSRTASLAQDFGRSLRNLVNAAEYRAIFPNLKLSQEARAAGRWNTSAGEAD